MLFEQQKNKEAARLFISIQDQLKQSDPAVIPSGVLTTVNTFVQALKTRLLARLGFSGLYLCQ